ncbi:hypothetical protein BCR39DRAFT_555813 [Naematelia encephala]|uniref:Uncharacterized protein n=1 Tax=Naematelia encephala TaxID=71784 RepID=A0A1Y2BNE1_9TREE|nr:hypothetical protein BCR39DRAFT_555813 [Naematelia encephala]
MPRAAKNSSIGRAALSAPYPLPIIVTRSHSHHAPPPPPAPTDTLPAPQASGSGFPTVNHNWRDLPPAIPPIPYPQRDPSRPSRPRYSWRIKLRGMIMSGLEGESSQGRDVELESVTDGPDLELIKRFGNWSLTEEKEQDKSATTNLLQTAFETSIPASYIESRVNYYPFILPHLAGKSSQGSSMLLPPPNLDAPITPFTPGNINSMSGISPSGSLGDTSDVDDSDFVPDVTDVSSWISGSEDDGEDEEMTPHASPRSEILETPETPRVANQVLTNFTPGYLSSLSSQHVPSSFLRSTAQGYESEASSTRTTITRIPRSKFTRERRHMYTSEGYVRKGKARATDEAVPALLELSRPFHSNFDSGFHIGLEEQPLTNSWIYGGNGNGNDGFSLAPIAEEELEHEWSPEPMSIDPRSATRPPPDWAALNIDRETRHHPLPSPVPGLTRGLRLPSAPAHRNAAFPIDKACHNFLLARKVHALKRRETMMRRAQQLVRQAQEEYARSMRVETTQYPQTQKQTQSRRVEPSLYAQSMRPEPSPMDVDDGYFAIQQQHITKSPQPPSLSSNRYHRPPQPPRKRPRIESDSDHTGTSPLTGLTRIQESELEPYYLPHRLEIPSPLPAATTRKQQSTYELMLAIAERKEDEARLLREMVYEEGEERATTKRRRRHDTVRMSVDKPIRHGTAKRIKSERI